MTHRSPKTVMDSHRREPDLAIFAATSGHSGVDRLVANLLPELHASGLAVDLLQVRDHGPRPEVIPDSARCVDLGSRHLATSLIPLVRYLRTARPKVMLSDKDRANRVALWARRLARVDTRCAVRLGTTVSVNLANKAPLEAWWQRRSMRRYERAETIIVPSEGAADDLARVAEIPRDRIHVLANPVVGPEFAEDIREPAPHPWLADDDIPVILAVGSLTPRKDYATLVRAFAQLRAERVCRLIILGDGPEREPLTTLAESHGVAGDVTLPGFTANPYPWMRHADAFAHSSRWEGLGIVLVEALALGLPIVATDCPSGPSEVLADGRHGWLVPVGDSRAMAGALAHALDHSPDRHELQAAASRYRTDTATAAYLNALGLPRRVGD